MSTRETITEISGSPEHVAAFRTALDIKYDEAKGKSLRKWAMNTVTMTTRALGSSVRVFPAELCLNINQASFW